MNFNILVVDDEKNIREGLGKALELESYNVVLAEDGKAALAKMNKHEIDLVLTDLRMPNMSGEDLLKKVASSYPTVPVIILTGHGTVENAVMAMRAGAYDFLTKPVNLERLSLLCKRALSTRQMALQHRALRDEVASLKKKKRVPEIIGKSKEIQKVFELIDQVAPTKASVLITGDSGVGKELVAEAVHKLSDRAENPIIKVHCAALTESLLESELFGHEKGSFTGASSRKKGRFELADGGTIFLDEIGEINANVQIKILRVLQEKIFERVGGEESVSVDVRIIAATNRNLQEEIQKGNFREDLYYRLNVVNIRMPSLNERREDIPILTSFFLKKFSEENDRNIEGIDSKARLALYNYSWPGNIRELQNCIESSVVMAKGRILTTDDLPPYLQINAEDNYIKIPMGATLSEAEKILIRDTLIHENGNKSKTADILNIGRKTLHRKIDEYNLTDEFQKKQKK